MRSISTLFLVALLLVTFLPLSVGEDRLIGTKDVRVNDDESFFDQQKVSWALTEEGYIYAVWEDNREGYWSIFFSRSFDGGRVWGDGSMNNNDVNVVDDPTGLYSHRDPAIAFAENGTLYVLWQDSREGPWRIYYSISENGGENWSASKPIGGPQGNQTEVVASTVRGVVWVAWLQEGDSGVEVLLSRLLDNGTFSEPERVDSVEGDKSSLFSTTDGSTLYLLWVGVDNGGKSAIYELRLRGENLSEGRGHELILVNSPQHGSVYDPYAYADSFGNLLLAYEEENYSYTTVKYLVQYPDGVLLGPYTVRSPWANVTYQADPSIVSDSQGNIYIFWAEGVDVDHLIKGGWTDRVGSEVRDVRIMDWTITMGVRPHDPEYTYSMMERGDTNAFLVKGTPSLFWIDARDDPNPSIPVPENYDVYFNTYPAQRNTPPRAPEVSVRDVVWNAATVEWERSDALDFKRYVIYLSEEEGFVPDEGSKWTEITLRNQTEFRVEGLTMNTTYYVKVAVEDSSGAVNLSQEVSFKTPINAPPRVEIISPREEVTVDRRVNLIFSVFDPDDNASVTLRLYGGGLPPGGEVLQNLSEGETGLINYTWDTSQLPNGTYLVKVIARDGANPPVERAFPPVTVFHPSPTQEEYLKISTVIPSPGSQSIDLRTVFRVVFSEEVNRSSIGPTSVSLVVGSEKLTPSITLLDDGITLIVDPLTLLPPLSDCTLTISSEVASLKGMRLDGRGVGAPSDAVFMFRVRADNEGPEVVDYQPTGTMVSPDTVISIQFSTWIDTLTVMTGIRIMVEGGGEVPFTYTYDSNLSVLIIHPKGLNYSETYVVEINGGLKGRNGLSAKNYLWNFTTLPISMAPDSDGDGHPDPVDAFPNDPNEWRDTDGDGVGDNEDKDDDNDGMPDKWEIEHSLDPLYPDGERDEDGDGYTNLEEYREGTDPRDPNSYPSRTPYLLYAAVIAVAVFLLSVLYYMKRRAGGGEWWE
ncbi:MAG: Ig-like domain-containing protein [Thermoplasmata archaeon]|nr:Ig-like domain-containing protein [Thermoplasmata archaeon]